MRKIQIGDLFKINSNGNQVLLQYVDDDRNKIAQLVRVFYHFGEESVDFEKLIERPELYMIFYPLAISHRKKTISKLGNYPLPNGFFKPKFMREPHIIKGKFLGWHIVNIETLQREFVSELSEKQKNFSPWGIWNKAYLLEHLEKNWTLDEWYYD